ncbi:hypothetical protein FDECE_14292 [Fusarium decemcellulare]|nr:hypothetical protein FDECE_14292 [Fusarium decemcellulare]
MAVGHALGKQSAEMIRLFCTQLIAIYRGTDNTNTTWESKEKILHEIQRRDLKTFCNNTWFCISERMNEGRQPGPPEFEEMEKRLEVWSMALTEADGGFTELVLDSEGSTNATNEELWIAVRMDLGLESDQHQVITDDMVMVMLGLWFGEHKIIPKFKGSNSIRQLKSYIETRRSCRPPSGGSE